jgi:two-component system phosphate regulon sensor histidine kinase PhoR
LIRVSITRLCLLTTAITFIVGLVVFAAASAAASDHAAAAWGVIGLLTAGASALAALVSVAVFGRWVVRPLQQLAEEVRHTEARLTSNLAQMQRDRSDMAALFQHMADGVLVLNAEDRVELANPAADRLLRRAAVPGRPLTSAMRDPDMLQVVRAARDGSPVRHPVEVREPDGRRSWIQVVATQLPTEQRILVLLQDVTELRHAENVRRDFVANVSHELKTPVASLKALVESLEDGALNDPECGPDFLRRMHVEVDGLAQLVAELLELARIEAGRLDLDLRTCRADQLVCDAIERIRPYAARVGLDVRLGCIEPDLEVQADPRQIGQVLSNLLSNAIKFTPPGGCIELGARRDGRLAEMWVSDSGVGIAMNELNRVFERFYKTDPSRTGSGTGLGLAICKHVVQAHGGTIRAESEGPGRGATFRFTLPATKLGALGRADC